MRLEISRFSGMSPLVDNTALRDEFATHAKNVRFDKGVLAPGALRLEATTEYPDTTLQGTAVRSVSKMFNDGTRFGFNHVDGADAFPSPVSPMDTWGRVYFSTSQGASFTTSDNYSPGELTVNPVNYRLGVPAPGGAPAVTRNSPNPGADNDAVRVAYCYTFVDKYGHEGAASPSSAAVTLAYDLDVDVSVTMTVSLPARVNFSGGLRRIYRAAFDGASSAWQYIGEVAAGTSTFRDRTPIGDEGETMVSENWYPAPAGMKNVCLVASAFAAGFIDNHVCYSELKLPHAWPFELQYPLKYAPVKLLPIRNGLFIATNGRPYWAEGTDPYSAIPQELAANAPCLSADSVVDMGDTAMYVSDEGIIASAGASVELVSRDFIDRAGMLELVDESCTAFAFDRRYVFSTRDDRWMAFSPAEGFVEHDFGFAPSQFKSVTFSVRDNQHYFAFNDSRVRVVDFDGVATSAEWTSKEWRTPPSGFSCFRVEADIYPVTVKVESQYLAEPWASSGEVQVDGPHLLRLPMMVGSLWRVTIKPAFGGQVYRLVLGQSGKEIA